MNITVTGRGIEVTAAMRSYGEEKLQAATNVLDMPMEAETVLRVEHNPSNPVPQVVEVTVRVKGAVVRVSEAAVDMYAAFDLAADRVSRQLRKYKTRVVDRRQRGAAPAPANEVDLAELIERPAEPAAEEDSEEILREKLIEFTELSVDQALLQTDLLGHDFFVFTNKDTGDVNVIYRRKDGGFGILKPIAPAPAMAQYQASQSSFERGGLRGRPALFHERCPMAAVSHFKTFSTHPACRIILDSTSAVTDELAERMGVDVVEFPFVMADGQHWDDQYKSLGAKEFYDRMRAGERVLTSAVPTGEFVEIFRVCAEDGVPTMYLSLTGGLSSSVNDARQAASLLKDEHPDFDLAVIDSCAPSLTAALLCQAACKLRDEGKTMREIVEWVEANKHRIHGYFTLESLDWLVAGGRVPKAAASVSAVLDMKADLTYGLDGSLTLTGVSRGRKKALKGLVKKFKEFYRGDAEHMIGIVDADDTEAAEAVEEMVRAELGDACPSIQRFTLDPTIGGHVGPGMVALAFWGTDRAQDARASKR